MSHVSKDADPAETITKSLIKEAQPSRPTSLPLSAEAWLAAIVENSDDAIISKSVDGIITSWNKSAERLFGFLASEAIGRPITILVPPHLLHEEETIIDSIRAGKRIEHQETVRRRKDGRLVDISLTASPVRDKHGAIIGASKIARDISERKRLIEQQDLLLQEMQHRVKNLFAVMNSLISMSEAAATNPRASGGISESCGSFGFDFMIQHGRRTCHVTRLFFGPSPANCRCDHAGRNAPCSGCCFQSFACHGCSA